MVTPAKLYNLQEENVQLRKELEAAQAELATVSDVCPDASVILSITCAQRAFDTSFQRQEQLKLQREETNTAVG